MAKVYLSPSSQWNNKYAYGNYTEAEICGKIAEATREELIRNGYDTRVGSNKSTISQRISESNNWGADLHIPIHTNAGGGDGTLVMCYTGRENNKYVQSIYRNLANLTPTKDDGIRVRTDLSEITKTECVCVYVECEYHDNNTLAKWIVENIPQIAKAVAKGVCEADGKQYTENVETESSNEVKYTVQVGAYSEYENAKAQAEKLRQAGFSCFIKNV